MTIDLTQIILAVITLISGLVARYLIPWMKGKLDVQQADAFNRIVSIGVFAAEQIFNSDEGAKKKAYVVDLLAQNGYSVDEATVNAAIEAEVKKLKITLSD